MKRMGQLSRLGWFAAVVGVVVATGCSVKTEASNVICVPDQSDICTDCPADAAGDAQSGRHVCAHDGKSFGACGQCVPLVAGGALSTPSTRDPGDVVTVPDPNRPAIDAACGGKLALVAGRDDPNDPFTYLAVYDGKSFQVRSTSGAPMRSAAATAPSGAGVVAMYRSKGDALVATTFANGAWSPPAGISATSNGTPTMTTWGTDVKAVFRQDDGYLRVATMSDGFWLEGLDTIGNTDLGPTPGLSEPSAVSTGAPGVAGAAVMVGYTDGAGGLYRQEWRGDTWLERGIEATTIDAGPFRPEIIPMMAGSFDLLSTYLTSNGELHFATRTSGDSGSAWSADAVTDRSAKPGDAVRGLGLPDGRAVVVFLDAARHASFMLFDPRQTPAWSAPAPLFATATPVLASTPQLVRDPCGAAASLAFASDGGVGIMRLVNDAWTGPFLVTGIPASTYATPVAASAH